MVDKIWGTLRFKYVYLKTSENHHSYD